VSGDRNRVRHAVILIATVIVTILPATMHNYRASRDCVPITSNGGVNFYIGNSEDATGIFYPPRGINLVTDDAVKTYVERVLGKDVTPSELSRYWFSEAFAFIRTNPAAAFRLFARKIALYFNGYEVPQIESFDIARAKYGTLQLLFINMWMLMSLGIMGMLYTVRRWRKYLLLNGYVLALSLSVVLFFVTSRYRVQIAPALALFAAFAMLDVLPRAFANLRKQIFPVVLLAVIVLATQPGLFALAKEDVQWREHTHEARRLSKVGQHDDALEEINKAIDIHPDYADSYIHRALIYKAAGKRFQVVEDYAHAVDLNPNLPTVQYDFGQILRQLKMYAPAVEAYRKAIELNPLMLEAHNNLGFTYRHLKRYSDANAQFRKVIELDPRYIKAYNNLGASLAESGRLDEAVDVLTRGIDVNPDYPNTYMNLAMIYIQKKEVRLAYPLLEKYIQLDPGDERAATVLQQLQVVIDGDTLGGE
jgi:tetratricopeptide (TPR) repeat protein